MLISLVQPVHRILSDSKVINLTSSYSQGVEAAFDKSSHIHGTGGLSMALVVSFLTSYHCSLLVKRLRWELNCSLRHLVQ